MRPRTLSPVVKRGSTAAGPFTLVIGPEDAGWEFSGLRVLELAAGEHASLATGPDEVIVLPLSGSCAVTCDGETFQLRGRHSVFSAVSDFAYVPRDARLTVSSSAGGRFAQPAATPSFVRALRGPVELRGAGQASRQVNNFCSPEAFEADRLIAVEVLTPGGNWSSYPPHKHDGASADKSALEEIYHFEVADGAAGPPGAAGVISGSTPPARTARSMSAPRSAPGTLSSSRTATTARPWPHRDMTCTTST